MERILKEIAAERKKQIQKHGYTAEHDDKNYQGKTGFELLGAAVCYILHVTGNSAIANEIDPFNGFQYENNRRKGLIKAAALIVAHLEKEDRAEMRAINQRIYDELYKAIMQNLSGDYERV